MIIVMNLAKRVHLIAKAFVFATQFLNNAFERRIILVFVDGNEESQCLEKLLANVIEHCGLQGELWNT
jgi:hypothetical protein